MTCVPKIAKKIYFNLPSTFLILCKFVTTLTCLKNEKYIQNKWVHFLERVPIQNTFSNKLITFNK